MKALTLPQPWPYAIAYAGCGVISLPRPVPDGPVCRDCSGVGTGAAAGLPEYTMDLGGHISETDCPTCDGTGREPLRVAIHAGKRVPDEYRRPSRTWSHGPWYPPPFTDYGMDDFNPHGVYVESIDNDWAHVWWNPKYLGAVVAVATITDCHPAWFRQDVPGAGTSDICCDSPWGTGHELRPHESMTRLSVFHWRIGDVEVLDEPVPARGRTGLWTLGADL